MPNDFISRKAAMDKMNNIAAEFLKEHTIQCDIAAGVTVDIKNDVIKTLPAADVVTREDYEHMKREISKQLLRTQRLMNHPGVFIPNLDMPCSCLECWFRSKPEELRAGIGLYKKISRCLLAPKDIEDPWRDVMWQIDHREDFCPLVQMKGETAND